MNSTSSVCESSEFTASEQSGVAVSASQHELGAWIAEVDFYESIRERGVP